MSVVLFAVIVGRHKLVGRLSPHICLEDDTLQSGRAVIWCGNKTLPFMKSMWIQLYVCVGFVVFWDAPVIQAAVKHNYSKLWTAVYHIYFKLWKQA